jgi:hypothetical protein
MAYSEKLQMQYDRRKSFYGKAQVFKQGDRLVLRSYSTDVAYIENGKPVVKGLYSATTTRHIKEFLRQNGFKAESSKQIIADYGEKQEETKFGVMKPTGEVSNSMSIDIGKIKSPDKLAYAYGYFQGKSGQPMMKAEKGDKLAPEYIRGYQDAKKGVKL